MGLRNTWYWKVAQFFRAGNPWKGRSGEKTGTLSLHSLGYSEHRCPRRGSWRCTNLQASPGLICQMPVRNPLALKKRNPLISPIKMGSTQRKPCGTQMQAGAELTSRQGRRPQPPACGVTGCVT